MHGKEKKTFLYVLVRSLAAAVFRTVCPITYHRAEISAPDAPYILVGNHQSMLDPAAVAVPNRRYEIRFLGKTELGSSPVMHFFFRKLHMIFVNRHGTDMAAMRECAQALREGHVLGIFPEGTRHQPEMMQTIESGLAVIAFRSRVPVIPAYIHGHIRPFHRVHVYFGKPIDMTDLYEQGMDLETIRLFNDRVRGIFFAMRKGAELK